LFLHGAQDFAMLGIYAREFEDCSHFALCLREEGLEVQFHKYFFGCATGVTGRKESRH
jgi:demethylmenaquinone methyltransferase/2-methoxy-6-polyprenyl-1,4-benzoquinol methylase